MSQYLMCLANGPQRNLPRSLDNRNERASNSSPGSFLKILMPLFCSRGFLRKPFKIMGNLLQLRLQMCLAELHLQMQ